ncbi:hypothetical protein LINPERHAP1_LOCUS19866, partial [Linum perenne]
SGLVSYCVLFVLPGYGIGVLITSKEFTAWISKTTMEMVSNDSLLMIKWCFFHHGSKRFKFNMSLLLSSTDSGLIQNFKCYLRLLGSGMEGFRKKQMLIDL